MSLVRDAKGTYRERRKPQQGAIDNARRAAELGANVSDCPYRDKRWRGVWLKAFAAVQQQELFPSGGGKRKLLTAWAA